MKKLRQLCAAVVFTLVLTTAAAFAGEIDTGGKTPPPPPPPASATETTLGEIPIDPNNDSSDEYYLIEDIALDLLRIMLSVF